MRQRMLLLSEGQRAQLEALALALHDPDTQTTPKHSEVIRAALQALADLSRAEQRRYVTAEMDRTRMNKRGPKPKGPTT